MSQQALLGDAWIREAQEASRLIEEMESRIKDQNPGKSVRDSARRKLLELGPKLDRLESLLHNPPAKPILTDQDLDMRQNMLSDLQLRTREIALSLYRLKVPISPGSLPAKAIEEPSKMISSNGQDDTKSTFCTQEHELLVSVLQKDDATRSQLQRRQTVSLGWKRWIWNVCWIIFLVLAAAALVLVLVLVCAVI
ncbi:uncharacterized protein LOC122066906 isoform X2 [Macadamia integrifolia]|uniref:uncharacterized protein LOC122066906 isoform X2 n=1 Tax=Macadamia integrifolia TaxID=60698 RepID=UPI001C500F4C|nr:uncharacterized protein LOC122066906 isoform X2 [Macadamia integrifolia]